MKRFLIILLLALVAPAVQAQTKMAHIDSKRIIDTLPSNKKALAELELTQKASVAELEEMQLAFQKKVAAYEAEYPTMTVAAREYRENELMEARNRIDQRSAALEEDMQKLNTKLFEPIEDRVRKAVENVATRSKIAYVTEADNAWYATGGVDITNEVIAEALKLDAEAMKAP